MEANNMVDNIAAIHDALKSFVDAYETTSYTLCLENLRPPYQKAKAALAVPERNCSTKMKQVTEADSTAALREGLTLLRQKITDWYMNGWIPYSKYDECEDIVKSALEKPPHNYLSALKA